jgi:hypothetical protein
MNNQRHSRQYLATMSLSNLNAFNLSPKATLLSLPTELQHAVIHHLTFSATRFLRQTCRHFSSLIPALYTLEALLQAERSEDARDLAIFACAVCLRLRRRGKFSDSLRKSAWGKDGWKRETRFCIECGTRPPVGADPKLRYKKGDNWTRFGMPYVKCKACGSVRHGVKERKDCEVCPGCWNSGRGRK